MTWKCPDCGIPIVTIRTEPPAADDPWRFCSTCRPKHVRVTSFRGQTVFHRIVGTHPVLVAWFGPHQGHCMSEQYPEMCSCVQPPAILVVYQFETPPVGVTVVGSVST